MSPNRLIVGLWCLAAAVASADEQRPSFEHTVAPFFAEHCVDCHGGETQEARLRLDQLDSMKESDRHLWTMIYEQLAAGAMPPEGLSRPSDDRVQAVLRWIRLTQQQQPTGRIRRLNRRELGQALHDLTGVDADFARPLPADGRVDGFDTGAAALQDAADSVHEMLEATRRAVAAIRFLDPPAAAPLTVDLVTVKKDPHRQFDPWKQAGIRLEKLPRLALPGAGALMEPKWPKDRSVTVLRVPADPPQGLVRLRLSVGSYSAFPEMPNPILWVRMGGRVLDRREISGPVDLEYFVQREEAVIGSKGLAIDITPRVELPYAVSGFENEDKSKPDQLPDGAGLFRPVWDRRVLREPQQQPRPFVVLREMELESDYVALWPPVASPSARWTTADTGAEGPAISDSPESAAELLRVWVDRAWRRPSTAAERQRFLLFYQKLRGDGLTFDEALRSAFQSVLLSAPFRYLASPADVDPVVARYAVASRLSFMLLGEPPDARLLQKAATGALSQPRELEAEIQRLLQDPRHYEGFVRPFVTQWLEMEQPITLVDDRRGKASYHFRRHLQDSMREETCAYVYRLLQDDRPARELVRSDWTMMNDTLSRFYGYPPLQGSHLRKVRLTDDDRRGGGLMSHAGIQSMLCWMGDNWVIYRGAWTARHILADPPQLPPLDVPELDSAAPDLRRMTPRELMAHHRSDSLCAGCHAKLDPVGFAFQNFDLSGRWRDVEYESYLVDELDSKVAWRGTGKTRPVDTAGRLPGGETFRSYREFQQLVIDRYQDDMVKGLLRNFLLYATGRRPDIADLAELDRIMDQHRGDGFPLQQMLISVLQTDAFLKR